MCLSSSLVVIIAMIIIRGGVAECFIRSRFFKHPFLSERFFHVV